MFKKILVPVDGSESALKALDLACKIARIDNATLHILHIPERLARDTMLVWGMAAVSIDASQEELERAGRKSLDAAKQAAAERGMTDVEGTLRQGDPARIIVEEAKKIGADAIFMGSRGLSNITGLIIGSVSHRVSHTAQCSVITVH
ncbi:Nucleotide-binding universal stress protein, UspA family [Modicisalibacter ilicicola DSM 19980]|uniref:Nucleotide-binding universal stress protein, UspA family n=1 Tax=Modicisalibacter ilicicola DSM 19980 TaxID=1121942 RepID=A0A1M4Y6X2_9GAMM|nr:universal stress protein [Halomonas ilicicola]SHF01458.1 Nucleotide-binding universal stress protein, UspA family [Halomonas ilicicola DSM 19980]